MLSKDQILQANDLPKEVVPVPEWGGEVIVRTMTGSERDAYESSIMNGPSGEKDFTNIRAKLCSKVLVDESGNLLFADADIISIGKKSAKALDRIFDVAVRLNGLSRKDIKDLEKN